MTDLRQLETPVLLVDQDRLERNVRRMAARAAEVGVDLRPHFKTSKMLEVTRLQRDAGAVGITCATAAELDTLLDDGVQSILWAHQPLGTGKVERLIAAQRRAEVLVTLDNLVVACALSERAREDGVSVPFLLEVDTGLGRSGAQPSEAVALARELSRLPGLELRGVMTHEGHIARHLGDRRALAAAAAAAAGTVVAVARELCEDGLPASIVSTGATPAVMATEFVEGITEARPGTYVFFDSNQVALGSATWDDCATTVLTSVVSKPAAGHAVVDAGLKALSGDSSLNGSGYGQVLGLRAHVSKAYEEHGVLSGSDVGGLAIGDYVRVVPNHVCGAVNMWSRAVVVRDGAAREEWSITSRR